MAKNLIIYYSRKGENYWNGSIKNIAKGNTEIVAEFIQNAVGGDLRKGSGGPWRGRGEIGKHDCGLGEKGIGLRSRCAAALSEKAFLQH